MKYIILLCLLVSCLPQKKKSSELNIALTGSISTLDPMNAYDAISLRVVYQIYETLLEYDYLKRPYELKPLLAENLPQLSEDKLEYTIKIKKNIPYHSHPEFTGKPRYVTAQDFINQFKRIAFLGSNSNGWWVLDGKIKGINQWRKEIGTDLDKMFKTNIPGIKLIDQHTFKVQLTQAYPQFLYALAMSFITPIPEKIIRKYQNNLNEVDIGTGPYQLDQWNRNLEVKLSKFKNYPQSYYSPIDTKKALPYTEKVNFKIIKEAQTRWLNFLTHKIDLLGLSKDQFTVALDKNGKLEKEFEDKGIQLQIYNKLTYWWLAFNMQDPIVGGKKNILLRKAIAHAVDNQKYIREFRNNVDQLANSIYPPGIAGYRAENKLPYSHDTEKAKELLKQAGHENGKGLPELNYDVRGSSSLSRQSAELLRSQLAKIGIKIKININTFPNFLKKLRTGKMQIWQGGWALDYPDAENILQLLLSKNHAPGPNDTYYSNAEFDQLFNQVSVLENGPTKFKIMQEMEKIINKDLPWIMQYYTQSYVLFHDQLKNIHHSPIINNDIKYYLKD